ncbi:MAG: hypothetical protein WAM97_02840 [Acidimicrobiales bacterium]
MFLLPRFKTIFLSPDFLARLPEGRSAAIRWRKVLLVGLSLMCAGGLAFGIAVGVVWFMSRDGGSPYKLNQALQQFKLLQMHDGNKSGLSGDLPVPGVYTYSTIGSESASAPGLPSSSYGYPATSSMTVFAASCGQDWRWQPLNSRYEDLVVCRSSSGGFNLHSRFDLDEFYGVKDGRLFSCTPGSSWLPASARQGETISGDCANGGNKNSGAVSVKYTGKVAGIVTLDVGGVKVPAVHINYNEKFVGDTVGSGSWSVWLDAYDGMILKETRTETSQSKSVVGWVPSTETLITTLSSLTPRQ